MERAEAREEKTNFAIEVFYSKIGRTDDARKQRWLLSLHTKARRSDSSKLQSISLWAPKAKCAVCMVHAAVAVAWRCNMYVFSGHAF